MQIPNVLSLIIVCLAVISCGGESVESSDDDNAEESSNKESSENSDESGSSDTSSNTDPSNAPISIEPLACGGVQCTELDDLQGQMTRFNQTNIQLEYCCTPTDQCNTRFIGDTDCPDPLTCGGVVCEDSGFFAVDIPGMEDQMGTLCCSPSDKCSMTEPGETTCPEPDPPDPDCPTMSEVIEEVAGGLMETFQEMAGMGDGMGDLEGMGLGCCLDDGTCGYLISGSCSDPLANFEGMSGLLGNFGFGEVTVYDCDGNVIEQEESEETESEEEETDTETDTEADLDAGSSPSDSDAGV